MMKHVHSSDTAKTPVGKRDCFGIENDMLATVIHDIGSHQPRNMLIHEARAGPDFQYRTSHFVEFVGY